MSESILSISDFKADASRLLDQIRDEPSRIVLTQNGRARAVVEDSVENALAVLDGRRDLRSLLLERLVRD
jgi:prevent-host-death family protein